MVKVYKFMVGIDVSKKTIDVACSKNGANSKAITIVFANNLKGFKELGKWLKEQDCSYKEALFCMENTGIYHRVLASYLLQQEAFVWVETPVQIKWSMGIQRGKSDKVDAVRIGVYAFRNQDKAQQYSQADKSLQNIADLLAVRQRLLQCIQVLKVPIKEFASLGMKEAARLAEDACKNSITTIATELKTVEEKLHKMIDEDEVLSKKFKYATSVRCVGFVAGLQLLVYTQGFTRFDNAKQIASYCGIAPFGYGSGTSVKGRTKVHNMANKILKKTMHMCSVSAVRHNEEMRTFFQRKVSEGKNKMSVLNAVRNKLIHRVFACVRDERMYELKLAA